MPFSRAIDLENHYTDPTEKATRGGIQIGFLIGYQGEMRKLRDPHVDDLDRLIRGEEHAEDHDLVLGAFVDQALKVAALPPSPSAELKHMAAVMEAAHRLVEMGQPVGTLPGIAAGPGLQASTLLKPRRRLMLSSLFASLASKLAAGGVAVAMAATGGLAANGNLPDSVQDKIAFAAEKVGIDIPTAAEEEEEESDPLEDLDEPSSEDGASNGKPSNEDVHAAIDSTEPGPERGKAVSEAARLKPEVEGDITTGSESKSVSADVHAAIDATDPGPERGKAVSEAASQNRQNTDVEEDELETDEEDEVALTDDTEGSDGNSQPGASKKNKP